MHICVAFSVERNLLCDLLAYLALKMEAVYSYETLVSTDMSERSHNSEDHRYFGEERQWL
jgi:hypothetical protein